MLPPPSLPLVVTHGVDHTHASPCEEEVVVVWGGRKLREGGGGLPACLQIAKAKRVRIIFNELERCCDFEMCLLFLFVCLGVVGFLFVVWDRSRLYFVEADGEEISFAFKGRINCLRPSASLTRMHCDPFTSSSCSTVPRFPFSSGNFPSDCSCTTLPTG